VERVERLNVALVDFLETTTEVGLKKEGLSSERTH
jgi:hypothetical protein